jgi:DegV family protein with EDD domain
MLMGRCDIAVIDSMTISAGLGILVEQAARLSMIHTQLEDVVRDLRRMISGVYSVFFVESMQTICKHGLMGEAQTILGTMLGIMPFITVEDGELVIMEKARSHTQAVDKLVEFATEFTDIERLVILSHTITLTDSVRMLQDRLALELPRMDFPTRVYDGILANYLGPDALGITIFENPDEE